MPLTDYKPPRKAYKQAFDVGLGTRRDNAPELIPQNMWSKEVPYTLTDRAIENRQFGIVSHRAIGDVALAFGIRTRNLVKMQTAAFLCESLVTGKKYLFVTDEVYKSDIPASVVNTLLDYLSAEVGSQAYATKVNALGSVIRITAINSPRGKKSDFDSEGKLKHRVGVKNVVSKPRRRSQW